jgi:hypothetical protein
MITGAKLAVHRVLRRMESGMAREATMTPLSLRYRRRAAEFARTADAFYLKSRKEDALRSVQSALSWIQLAENEELLGGVIGAATQ